MNQFNLIQLEVMNTLEIITLIIITTLLVLIFPSLPHNQLAVPIQVEK